MDNPENNLASEEFEDTKGINRKSKKDRQHNGQKKKDKGTNSDLQTITHKTKDRITRTPLNNRGKFKCSGRISSSCFTSGIYRYRKKKNKT
jgi:hypothetical protein